MSALYLGIDVGTSGIRACLIDRAACECHSLHVPLPAPARRDGRIEQAPRLWWDRLTALLDRLSREHPLDAVVRLAIDGTSATLLACDDAGRPLGPALMYNDRRAETQATRIACQAPAASGAHGAASSLAKALWLVEQRPSSAATHLLHQADWLAARLTGQYGISDENNALKLGYDPILRDWPSWIADLGLAPSLLPKVVTPGSDLGPLQPALAARWGLQQARVVAGTTDSTAAFLATGADRIGQAVTSLGSTLVVKVLADRPVFAPEFGVYSHRLGSRWLVGGASNSGGAVLRQCFTDAQLRALEADLRPDTPSGLDYYPLPGPGERFPVSDPTLPPRLAPRPADDALFLQGMLEGIARIEQRGYRLLQELGAPYPTEVVTVGGGARNAAWRQIRSRLLAVPVTAAAHQDAAYGAALLARQGAMT